MAEALELAQGLALVALGEMEPDEAGSGTLPQGIDTDRRTGGERSFTETARGGEAVGKGLQGVEAELAPVLGLEKDPVLVPAGEKITGEGPDRCLMDMIPEVNVEAQSTRAPCRTFDQGTHPRAFGTICVEGRREGDRSPLRMVTTDYHIAPASFRTRLGAS